MARLRKGRASLLERAVEVGPRGKGGVLMIPAVDVEATLDHLQALEDEIEDLMLAQVVAERLQTPKDDLLSVEELAGNLGLGHLVTEQ
jgi:hypothetical protein